MSGEKIGDAIRGAIQYLTDHPDEARYTDSPATAKLEEGLRCRVEGKPSGVTVVTDMPPSVGGGGSAPSPGWLSRAAQASCDATVIAMRAAQEGISLSLLEVTVDSESDDRGLLGMNESTPAGPLTARVRVRIAAGGVSEERLRRLVEWADHHSPVTDCVRRAVPTALDVEVVVPQATPSS
jgi:uncharacterized OsmC-like protein